MSSSRAPAQTALFFAAALALHAFGHIAAADVIYATNPPGGPLGFFGADVCSSQSVAVRFTPEADYTLDEIRLWFMSNDFSGATHPLVLVSLRPDDDSTPGVSIPSTEIIENYSFNVSAVGWDPMLDNVFSDGHPRLCAGVHYWVVAESSVPCGEDGVWVYGQSSGFTSIANGDPTDWQPGGPSGVNGIEVYGTPFRAGDVNADGAIDGADVQRFTNAMLGTPDEPGDVVRSDMNCDEAADLLDIEAFVDVLLGQ